MTTPGAPLEIFVIYDRPNDLPDGFVVRRHVITETGSEPRDLVASNLETIDAARDAVPSGRVNIGRHPEDDAKIVEVWI